MQVHKGRSYAILNGDVQVCLKTLPSDSIQCVVTSPPYYGLRAYGTNPQIWDGDAECEHEWGSELPCHHPGQVEQTKWKDVPAAGHGQTAGSGMFCSRCGAWRGELGLEPTPELYISHLTAIFSEVRRVLRPDGTLWLNIGDSYWGGKGSNGSAKARRTAKERGYTQPKGTVMMDTRPTDGNHPEIKAKDLIGIPWMLAFSLRADGWYLRQDVVWQKLNPMPESVADRCTKAHEYVFMLTKSPKYFCDMEAVKEPSTMHSADWNADGTQKRPSKVRGEFKGKNKEPGKEPFRAIAPTRNRRSVWTIATKPFKGAHFACVSEDTECLTLSGWKTYDSLQIGELCAAYDLESGSLQYEPLKEVCVYDIEEDVVYLGGRDLKQICTPNHRCLVKTRDGVTKIVEASSLKPGHSLLTASDWKAGTFGHPSDPGPIIAEIVGWVLSEAHVAKQHITVYQSLTANPDKVARIEELLNQAGFHYVKHIRTRGPHWIINKFFNKTTQDVSFQISGDGTRILQGLVGLGNEIPTISVLWSKPSIEALLRGIVLGDGHTRKDGRTSVIQKSKKFIDWVQILYNRLGKRCIVSPRRSRTGEMYTAFIVDNCWHSLRGTNGKTSNICLKPYRGKVWCPSLPSKTFVARREGRIWITGNTMPEALVEPCVLAGTSAAGCCSECGKPWKRILKRGEVISTGGSKTGARANNLDTVSVLNQSVESAYNTGEFKQYAWETVGWTPSCDCESTEGEARVKSCECSEIQTRPCVVLDPFSGSGTVGVVALRHGQRYIGIELNPEYVDLSIKRIEDSLDQAGHLFDNLKDTSDDVLDQ